MLLIGALLFCAVVIPYRPLQFLGVIAVLAVLLWPPLMAIWATFGLFCLAIGKRRA